MKVLKTTLDGCLIINPAVYKDERGFFCETFHEQRFKETTGISTSFVQDNQSQSSFGVLRGLHYQIGDYAQAKLVRVIQGKVLDIVVDLRRESATFGEHFSIELDAESMTQLYVPRGFAHGFVTLSEQSIFAYKCDNYYHKDAEQGIRFDDATLGLDWHLKANQLVVSNKDLELPDFKNAKY
ncbi:MAG: dTDP-4-dehydrorhamnose 3,5-epimerase [Gilvibacter sp.]